MPVPGSAASSGDGGGFSARLGGSDELDGASGLMLFHGDGKGPVCRPVSRCSREGPWGTVIIREGRMKHVGRECTASRRRRAGE